MKLILYLGSVLPKPRDGPFEQSLNRWLGATLVPALLAASKARKLTGGV